MDGLELRPYEPAAAPHVLALWWRALGEPYPLREAVLRQCLEGNPSYQPGDAIVAWKGGRAIGFAFIGLHRLSDPETAAQRARAWLQAVVVDPAWRRRGIGSDLVARLARIQPDGGPPTIEAGGGFSYLWPGIPTDLSDALPFATALGFRLADETYDLRGDVSGLTEDETAARLVAQAGLTVDAATAADRDGLLTFLIGESWAEWWQDMRRFLDDGGDPADVLLLRESGTDGRAIRGLARIHTPASRPVGPPLFWTARRPPAAGGLGPIGVAAALRGRGLGRALLAVALGRLRDLGLYDVVIDWTVLLRFYGPFGFRPWMTFRAATAPTDLLAGLRGKVPQ